jgi:hypothetical protein
MSVSATIRKWLGDNGRKGGSSGTGIAKIRNYTCPCCKEVVRVQKGALVPHKHDGKPCQFSGFEISK